MYIKHILFYHKCVSLVHRHLTLKSNEISMFSPNNAVPSQSSTVFIVLVIDKNEYNRGCDITALLEMNIKI